MQQHALSPGYASMTITARPLKTCTGCQLSKELFLIVEWHSASYLELTFNITGANFVGNPGYGQNYVSMIANNASNQSNHKVNVVIINIILSNNLFQTLGKECIFFVNMNQSDLNLTIQDVILTPITRTR